MLLTCGGAGDHRGESRGGPRREVHSHRQRGQHNRQHHRHERAVVVSNATAAAAAAASSSPPSEAPPRACHRHNFVHQRKVNLWFCVRRGGMG